MSGKNQGVFRGSAAEARELRISYMPHTLHDIELCDHDVSNIYAKYVLW